MPKREGRNIDIPHLVLFRMYGPDHPDNFSLTYTNAFEVTNFLNAWLTEAGVKGCVLLVTCQQIPAEEFYPQPDNPEMEENENG